MSEERTSILPSNTTGQTILMLASLVIIVAGIRAASSIFVPFLLAAFVSLLCAPGLFWLQEKGLPTPLALLVVLLGLLGIGVVFGSLIGTSIDDFTRLLPTYQKRVSELIGGLPALIERLGLPIELEPGDTNPFDPRAALGLAGNLAGNLGALLNNAFLLFLTICFILLEASSFPEKVRVAFGRSEEVEESMSEIGTSIRRYLGIKTLTSMATGFLAYAVVIVLGVQFAPLWGLLAFILNFIPAIGSVAAAIPPVALALVDNTPQTAAMVAIGYLGINLSIGSFIEPRVMGGGMGISPLVVLMSLFFWGWVLGPVGMVLAVPLTVILRIMLASQPHTQWIATLLGPGVSHLAVAASSDDAGSEAA